MIKGLSVTPRHAATDFRRHLWVVAKLHPAFFDVRAGDIDLHGVDTGVGEYAGDLGVLFHR